MSTESSSWPGERSWRRGCIESSWPLAVNTKSSTSSNSKIRTAPYRKWHNTGMRIRKIWHRIMLSLGPGVAFFLIKCLQWTMRIEELNGERIRGIWARGGNVIGAFWHGRLLMTPLAYGGSGLKILISRHRDGELITRTVRHFGLETVRGSTTRGGIAGIKGLARAFTEGDAVGLAPDR